MSAPDGLRTPWVIFAICCLFLVVVPVAMVRHWTGTTRVYDYRLSERIYRSSRRLRHGHVRALPVVFGWLFVFCLTILLTFLAPQDPPQAGDRWEGITRAVVIGSGAIALALYWMVVLFNRPKFIVAPDLRDESGAAQVSSPRADR